MHTAGTNKGLLMSIQRKGKNSPVIHRKHDSHFFMYLKNYHEVKYIYSVHLYYRGTDLKKKKKRQKCFLSL